MLEVKCDGKGIAKMLFSMSDIQCSVPLGWQLGGVGDGLGLVAVSDGESRPQYEPCW